MKHTFSMIAFIAIPAILPAQLYTEVETFAGTGNAALLDGSLSAASFRSPYSLSLDPATGAIYVADAFNNSIRRIQNGMVTTIAGNGQSGDVDGIGAAARFYVPTGIDYHDGFVYVCDNGNNKIKRIDQFGNVVTIAGTGSPGSNNGPALQASFYNPTEVRVNSAGVVYVSDYGNHTIRKIENGVVSLVAGGTGSAGDQLGTGANARFNRPTGIVFDDNDNLYVADQVNCKVKKVTASGVVTLLAGSGAEVVMDGNGPNASFMRPTYMGWDQSGALIVGEWMSNKIRRVTLAGAVSTVAGSGIAGYADGPVATAQFNAPYGICVDQIGNIYVGDKLNNRIRRIIASPPPCLAQAGSLLAGQFDPCLGDSGTVLTATPGGDAVVPAGSAVCYLLSSGNDQLVQQVANVPTFTVTEAGEWRMHTLVYDPSTFDIGSIEPGVTSIADLAGIFMQGGGSVCGSLDMQGVAFTTIACGGPCLAASGGMEADNVLVCLIDGQAHLTASPVGSQVVPPGYTLVYLLSRTNGLIIEQMNTAPSFTVTTEDVWRIHAFVYQPSTFDPASIVMGSTLIYDIQPQLVEWGGGICASLDISGGAMKSAPCGWTCSLQDTVLTICYQGDPVELLDLLPNTCAGGTWADPSGGSWSGLFDPASNVTGEYVYSVVDPNGAIAKMSVTVELVECPNDAPVIGKGGNGAGQTTGVNTGTNVQPGVKAWPIPVTDKLYLAAPTGAQDINGIEVFDASGKPMTIAIQRAADRIVLDTEHLPAGVYFVRVRSNGHAEVVRFLKHAPR